MKHRTFFTVLCLLIFTALGMPAQPALAATLTAGSSTELIGAIVVANTNFNSDTIILTNDITLTSVIESNATYGNTGLPALTTQITIEGQGHSITRGASAPNFRILRAAAGSTVKLYNLTISGGAASGGSACVGVAACGGGIFNEGTMEIVHSRFSGNSADSGGGIFNNDGGDLMSSDNTFFGNSASQGGGAAFNQAAFRVSMSRFVENSSQYNGGGILSLGIGTQTVSGSTFSGNTAVNGGGGVYFFNIGAATQTISSSTFSGNTGLYGGGVYSDSGIQTISSNTFSGNSAQFGGGVFFLHIDGGTQTINSTFSDNIASSLGGGIYSNLGIPQIRDSVVMHNSGGNCGGTISGDNFNLADDASCGSGFINSPNINLGPLADNGGSTLTFALGANSVAIDSANPVTCPGTFDQRDILRGIDVIGGLNLPQGGDCDVGAVEYGAAIRTMQFASASSSFRTGLASFATVPLVLDGPLPAGRNVILYVWVSGGTAVSGTDYVPFGVQAANFSPGSMKTDITINLLTPASSDKTMVLSFATQNGPGFTGAVRLGAQQTHTLTLKPSVPTASANRNFYTTDTPILTWTAISNASGYEIQVDTDTAFIAPYSFTDTAIPAGQLFVTTTHLDNGTYFWRVRAKGGSGAYSTPERFEVFN